MKAFVRQQVSLQVRTVTPLTKEKLQKIVPVKDEDGIIVGYKECSPSPSPSPKPKRSHKLHKQTPLDMYEDDGSDSLDDPSSPFYTPKLNRKSRSSLPDDQLFKVTYAEKKLEAAVHRKRSRSDISPILMARVVGQLKTESSSQSIVSPHHACSEDEEHCLCKDHERNGKVRNSPSRNKNRKVKSLMRKRAKSCSTEEVDVNNVSTVATVAVATTRFKRKTSIFRGKSKDIIQRTRSIPNESDFAALCIPGDFSLERKHSFKNSLKEAINSTLKSPRLNRRTGEDAFHFKGKSFDDSYCYGFKLEVAQCDNPEDTKVILSSG